MHKLQSELGGVQLLMEAWDSDLVVDDLVGAFELDLGWVWAQENHEIQKTWVALGDTRSELQRGEVQGYLLVSVAVVPAGFELNTTNPKLLPSPALDIGKALLPPSIDLKCQELHLKLYYAEDVVGLDDDGHSDTYVRVHYGNQSVSSSASEMSGGMTWHEDLAVPIIRPKLGPKVSERVRITLWDKDRLSRDDAIGVAYINLADVPESRDNPHTKRWGVPTWVDLYGAPAHVRTHEESASKWVRGLTRTVEGAPQELARKMSNGQVPGSTYRGRVLIAAQLQVRNGDTLLIVIHAGD